VTTTPRTGSSAPTIPATPRPAAVALALATVYLVWGSTYLAIKVAIGTLPPLLMAGARFLPAGAVLYLLARRHGDRRGDRPTRAQWREALILGVLMLVGGNGMVTVAEERIDSGVAALLVAMVPLWMAVLDRVVWQQQLSRRAVVGLVLGFAGVAVLIDPWGASLHLPSALMVLAGTVSWAYGSLRSRAADLPARPLVSTGMQMLAAGAVFVVLGVARGELAGFDPGAVSGASLAALAYLVTAGSLVAFSAYVWLLRNAPAPVVATYAYVNPVIAVGLGAMMLDEVVGPRTFVAGATIVVAVALIIRSRARETPSGRGVLRRLRQGTP
jgi:drug/metabolite transporter (DMT)-like permease